MKRTLTVGLVLLLFGSFRAFAQAPNSSAEHSWQTCLARHPGLAEHPEWLNDPNYLQQHPNMTKWLKQHPAVFQQARERGMWEQNGTWHDSSWWHEHDADAMYKNHPEWAEHHRDWHGDNDGDADDQRHWHIRNWWVQHHPNWSRITIQTGSQKVIAIPTMTIVISRSAQFRTRALGHSKPDALKFD